jgi:transposase
VGGEERGYDPAKKVQGRKRHLLVDTEGLVVKAKVHSASAFDRDGIKPLMGLVVGERFPRLSHLWLGAGYNGKGKGRDWVERALSLPDGGGPAPPRRRVWVPEGREPPPRPTFMVLPRRWVVERTFAWLGQNRRISKDYERLPETGEAVDSLMRLFRRFVSPSDPVSSPEHPF